MSYISQVLPSLLDGAAVTLQVFCIVIVLSIPIGAILAFLMQIKFKPLQWLLTLYVWIMRGTPLLLQLIFFYYVLPSVGVVMDRMPAAILAFTLNYAAYFAEIFRGGIAAIPKGQYEAAKVLKLNQLQTIHYIILPTGFSRLFYQVFSMKLSTLSKILHSFMFLGLVICCLQVRQLLTVMRHLHRCLWQGAIYLLMIGIVTLISKQTEKKFDYYK